MKFILASSNTHKAQEFDELFRQSVVEVELAPAKLEVEESGTSFNENAFLKAHAYYKKFNRPVLADDSGLIVEALPDQLGIYSARFGGEGLSNQERALLLLEKMQGIENRSAYFHCTLCFILSNDEIYFFEGRLAGEIGKEYRGETGFGYDPVFIPSDVADQQQKNLTLAELPEWKRLNSHRAQAAKFAMNFWTN